MACGCGKKRDGASEARRAAVRALALEYARSTGKAVALYRCADYDFAELDAFDAEDKTEVEYII